jgi:hypothetical protein
MIPARRPTLLPAALLPALVLAAGCSPSSPAALPAAQAARLAALEDREAIRQLLVDYGATTQLVFFVWYRDWLVRTPEGWKFSRREIGSGTLPGEGR